MTEDITITNGKPVKARRYYHTGTSKFEKHRRDQPLYVIGDERNGKISHTGDVKDTQATKSTVTYVYGGENTEWETLENILGKFGRGQQFHRIYLYRGGNRVKALKSYPEGSFRDMESAIKTAENREIPINESSEWDNPRSVNVHTSEVTA